MHEQTKRNIGSRLDGERMTPLKPVEMNGELTAHLSTVADVVREFALVPLESAVRACQALSDNEPIDLAVLGQFKSGKSSLLNAVLGEAILPVGALPLTAVITRIVSGPKRVARVVHLDGSIEEVPSSRIAEFVTEAGNPGNQRRVAVVEVLTPAMNDLRGVRLVDTPGLGSMFAHNTEATRAWMPNVAAAMVTVSAERPLSENDLHLMAEARQTAPRVIVVLTKVDLLSDAEREQVIEFLERGLNKKFDGEVIVVPFSVRVETQRWLHQLRENLLLPVAQNVAGERKAALAHKLNALTQSCREYLSVGIQAAERTEMDREQLRAAVFTEKVSLEVIQDELKLAEQGAHAGVRPEFEKYFLAHHSDLTRRISQLLTDQLPSWQGNLAVLVRQFEKWLREHLVAELTRLSNEAVPVAGEMIERSEERFRRIVEAFRDRLNRNVREATGVTVSPVAWEAVQPELDVIPVDVGNTFMVHWDLVWWLLPMKLVGGIFRRHVRRQVSGEVEKNLWRLASDWTRAVEKAVAALRLEATKWIEAELLTLDQLLRQQPGKASAYQDALRKCDSIGLAARNPMTK